MPSSIRFLIATACATSIAIAMYGVQSIWDVHAYATQRDPFWYRDGIALGMAAAVALAFAPPFRLPRLVRVAVLLPVFHVVAMIVAMKVWAVLREDLYAWVTSVRDESSPIPSLGTFAFVFAMLVAAGAAIGERRGEWAHATVMLSLSLLLLLGLWLPIVCAWWTPNDTLYSSFEDLWRRRFDYAAAGRIELAMLVPPIIGAIAFTRLAFRRRARFAALRARIALWVKILFAVSLVLVLTVKDSGALMYLENTYKVVFAAGLAVVAYVMLLVATWASSRLAHARIAGLPRVDGVIVEVDGAPVATLEATSWLRGPRLATRPFAVATPSGTVPVTSADVLAPVPAATLAASIGGHTALLAPGDRVTLAAARVRTEVDPFRTMEAIDVVAVMPSGATPHRFADVALVAWRPAVAYLAILVAVAAPGLAMIVF